MKRNDLTLGGLLLCLQLLFLFISKIIIGSELILLLFLPLVSSFYTLKTNRRSVFVFALSSFILCFLFDPINTFIYILPALLVGISYGILRKKGVKELSLIYITSLVHFISLLITLVSFKFFFIEFDLLGVMERFFSSDSETAYIIMGVILFVLAIIQSFLVHIISEKELNKFNYTIKREEKTPRWFLAGLGISLAGVFTTYLFSSDLVVIFILLCNVFLIPFVIEGITNFKYKVATTLLLILFALISLYLFSILEVVFLPLIIILILLPLLINILHSKR